MLRQALCAWEQNNSYQYNNFLSPTREGWGLGKEIPMTNCMEFWPHTCQHFWACLHNATILKWWAGHKGWLMRSEVAKPIMLVSPYRPNKRKNNLGPCLKDFQIQQHSLKNNIKYFIETSKSKVDNISKSTFGPLTLPPTHPHTPQKKSTKLLY